MTNNSPKTIKVLGMPIGGFFLLLLLLGGLGWFIIPRVLGDKGNNSTNTPQLNVPQPQRINGQREIQNAPAPVQAPRNVQAPTFNQFVLGGSTSVNELGVSLQSSVSGLEWQATGSGAGIQSVLNGSIDMAISSRELTESEKSQGLVQTPIGSDSIAFFVDASNRNAPDSLDRYQLQGILNGTYTDWSEVGGNPGQILLVVRGDGGTKESVLEGFEIGSFSNNAVNLNTDSTTIAIQTVTDQQMDTDAAIAFATAGQACGQQTIRVINIEGLNPADTEYVAQRYIYAITNGQPTTEEQALIDTASSQFSSRFSVSALCPRF